MKTLHASSAELTAELYAQRITAHLDEGLTALPHQVIEQLRAGRVQAVAQRKRAVAVRKQASLLTRLGTSLALGGGGTSGWGYTLMSAIPVLALVAGMMVMGSQQDETGITEIAEVDAALLSDDLPPAAYADPGFVQFLKTRSNDNH